MSQKRILVIISLITVASLLLAACGDPSTLPPAEQTAVAEVVRDAADFMENGPEIVATQAVGTAIEYVYDAEPNLAALLPPELCPNPQTLVTTDSEGWEHEIWVCNQHTWEDILGGTSFEADLAIVGVAALSPAPGDELLAVVSLGAKRVIIIIATAVVAEYTARGLVQMAGHSDRDHDPNFVGTSARRYIEAILLVWAGLTANGAPPPNDKFRCGLIKAGETVVRVVVFMIFEDDPSMGRLAWYDVQSQQWGGSFTSRIRAFLKGPKSAADRGWTWESNDSTCSNLPGGPPPLQPAH